VTVSTTTRRVAYSGNGSTTAFSVPFVFFGASELQVIARASDGVETVQALSTNYTVSGGNGATGTVTAVVAPPVGVSWTIIRQTARTQLTDYVPNDPFPAQTHERALDRLTAIVQEVEDGVFNALSFPVTEPGPYVLPSSTDRAGKFLAFDSVTGVPVLSAGTGSTPSGLTIFTVAGATHTAVLTQANGHFRCTAAGGCAVTIPANDVVAFPVGTMLTYEQAGAAAVAFAGGVGVTLRVPATYTAATAEQYGVVQALKVATNEWVIYGHLDPA
jgi:hypothetical protein